MLSISSAYPYSRAEAALAQQTGSLAPEVTGGLPAPKAPPGAVPAVQPPFGVQVSFSAEGQARFRQGQKDLTQTLPGEQPAGQAEAENSEKTGKAGQSSANQLTEDQQTEVTDLAQRDRQVRAHEQAHVAAGGNLVRGGASFSYTTGPDGKRYATGGEVQIDSSPVDGDPRATMLKAQRIRAAAMAPADPSAQDIKVAAQATRMASEAAHELAQQTQEKSQGAAAAGAKPAGGNRQPPAAGDVPGGNLPLNQIAAAYQQSAASGGSSALSAVNARL